MKRMGRKRSSTGLAVAVAVGAEAIDLVAVAVGGEEMVTGVKG